MAAPNTFQTRYTPSPTFVKAHVDADKMSVASVLTYPIPDLEGDFVEPAGGDYSAHASDPWVDLEHNQFPAGWGRESLSEPDAPYAVALKALTIGDKIHSLPVATTYFDPHERYQTQVFALIERDILPGVSLEFRAAPGVEPRIRLAKSLLNPSRPAYHFPHWQCVRWTHCHQPVNPGALTVKKAVDPALDPLIAALQTRKIGSETLHPTILKSLSKYLPDPSKKTTVRLEKAMPMDPTAQAPTDYDAAPETEDGGEKATPTAQTAYDGSQMLKDLCAHLEDSLKTGEHVMGKKKIMKVCAMLDSASTKLLAIGDGVAKDVAGDEEMSDDEDEEPKGGMPDEDEEPDEEPDEEDEGVMKCFKHPRRKVYRKSIKRFTAKEVRKAQSVGAVEATPEAVAKLAQATKRLDKMLNRL